MAVASRTAAPAVTVDSEALRNERRARVVQAPVGWPLGPELLGQLKKILRRRSDPREWMPYYRGCVHDECWARDGSVVKVVDAPAGSGAAVTRAESAPASHNRSQSAERTISIDRPVMRPAPRAE